jgi:hypothetical protein
MKRAIRWSGSVTHSSRAIGALLILMMIVVAVSACDLGVEPVRESESGCCAEQRRDLRQPQGGIWRLSAPYLVSQLCILGKTEGVT